MRIRVPFIEDPEQAFTVDKGADLRIMIPAPCDWGVVFFLSCWLSFWVYIGVGLIRTLPGSGLSGRGAFNVVWLAAWIWVGGTALASILWMIGGEQRVVVDRIAGQLAVRTRVFGFEIRSRSFTLSDMSNLRPSALAGLSMLDRRSLPFGRNGVLFDCGARTAGLGRGLDHSDARLLINTLQAYCSTLA